MWTVEINYSLQRKEEGAKFLLWCLKFLANQGSGEIGLLPEGDSGGVEYMLCTNAFLYACL